MHNSLGAMSSDKQERRGEGKMEASLSAPFPRLSLTYALVLSFFGNRVFA